MGQPVLIPRARLTTPRAAAIAGILFSLLFLTSLVLVRVSVPADHRRPGRGFLTIWHTVNLA